MAEITPPAQGEPLAGDPQATTPLAGTSAPKPLAGADEEPMTLDEAKKLRQEHAALRKRIKQYEEVDEAAKLAALTDMEKTTKRADDAEAALKEARQQIAAHNVYKIANGMNFNNPDIATRLVIAELPPDASDTDIAKALQALATSDPYLIKAADSTPPAAAPRQVPSNPPRGATNPVAPAPFDPRNPPSLQTIWNKPKQ